jgi:hypothetical protein
MKTEKIDTLSARVITARNNNNLYVQAIVPLEWCLSPRVKVGEEHHSDRSVSNEVRQDCFAFHRVTTPTGAEPVQDR